MDITIALSIHILLKRSIHHHLQPSENITLEKESHINTAITPEREFTSILPVSSSSIDDSTNFTAYVLATTHEPMNALATSITASMPESAPDTTYFMKELTVSTNNNVIDSVATNTYQI